MAKRRKRELSAFCYVDKIWCTISTTMKRRYVIFIIFVSLLVFSLIIFNTVFFAGSDEIPLDPSGLNAGSQEAPDYFPSESPAMLSIPRIKVKAQIDPVGITPKGNMATPRNYSHVGWYRFGTLPGEKGSAVLAGHVNNGLSMPAVFARLDELEQGDDIYVTDGSGDELHFKVSQRAIYNFAENVPEVFNQDDDRYLKLITCTGTWQEELRTHDSRLVVTAVLAD